MSSSTKTAEGVVALFNASDDTIDMVQTLLTASGSDQTLIWCHFADLKKGIVDFAKYMHKHNPEVVIFDLSPPYDENWRFFKTMRDAKAMTAVWLNTARMYAMAECTCVISARSPTIGLPVSRVRNRTALSSSQLRCTAELCGNLGCFRTPAGWLSCLLPPV